MKDLLIKTQKEFGGAIFILVFLLLFVLFGLKNVALVLMAGSIILSGYELYKLNRDKKTQYLSFLYPLFFFVMSLVLLFINKLFH